MGTISDKLMRIISTKEDIRQALISKGYDVPTSIPFKEYAKMISDLPCRVDSFPDIEGIVARYSALGLTNEQMAANPVWVDKTGNGHDIQLKNFSWKGMSGVGGYVQDFNDFRNNATVDKIRIDEQGSNSIKVTILTTGIGNAIYIPKNIYQFNKSYFIKISSEGYDEGDMALSFYAPSTSTATTVTVSLNPNGVTEIPAIKEDDFLAVYINVSGKVGSFTVEQLPLYPGATEEELTKIKDYFVKTYPWLFPDQAWTVVGKTNKDEDRATIANITGNGNDLVLSNFGFAEGSGYGLYKLNFNNWFANSGSGNVNIVNVVNPHKIVLEQSQEAVGAFFLGKNVSYSGELKISVSNKPSDIELSFGSTALGKVILNEGINIVKINPVNTSIGFFTNKAFEAQNIIIEQIPEYEGYLVTDGVDDKAVSKQFKFGENFTVILDFKFPVKKISYCGFDLSSKVRIQNLQGSGVYVVLKGNKTLIPSNVVRAVTSEGKVYDENWNEYNIVPGNISSNYTMVNLGFDGSNQFAESATKLAGIYSSALSKDDCIKAYNYLQTLKSK